MKQISKLALALGTTLLSLSVNAAIPNTAYPTTFLGPTLRLGLTNTLTDTTAYSLAGELGAKNERIGATLGWKISEVQRLKISADYLWQNINYAFFSGNESEWVKQASVGAAYQYDILDYSMLPQLDLTGYWAHAPSKTLDPVAGLYYPVANLPFAFLEQRRIAGSTSVGLAPGMSIAPWEGGRVGFDINYDRVDYNQRWSTPSQDAIGIGGTFRISQLLAPNVALNALASVRKPFNNFGANLSWLHIPYYGDWVFSLFGDYTAGKNTLPNTWDLGFSADYLLDGRCPPPRSLKGDLKGEGRAPISDNLVAWTADPAVYLPQVLAITDSKVDQVCANPVRFVGTIPNDSSNSTNVDISTHFTGTGLTYTILSISPALATGDTITINHITGIINSFTPNGAPYTVVVAATNGCGTGVSNPFVLGTR